MVSIKSCEGLGYVLYPSYGGGKPCEGLGHVPYPSYDQPNCQNGQSQKYEACILVLFII